MNTSQLKLFAQNARRQLMELVSTKLSIVLDTNSAARRENEKAVKELEKEISRTSENQVVEKVAYIWFNRFCALRFMDVNRYTSIGVVSPAEGLSQPEILMEAKQGHIDEGLRIDKGRVFGLLNETIPSPEPQQEAYRMLLVAVCNDYYSIMPFLFERIADYTELLMPDDLLSDSSVLTATREALSEDACSDVEVIGWLYQFYISEKKDEVFAGLKKNKKVTPENIPAATQLFTPNWIVRYLVENSLGRLWMLNNPGSRLIDRMDYYIKPEQEESGFLVIKSPEEIKICDPACGSGHMLVYAFEILYAIYEEQGYDAPKIPQLIFENNLYGIEIDERAGELAAFALCMKAREKYRRFFKKNVHPNICVLENVTFEAQEVKSYLDTVNPDLFTMELSTLLYQFKEADNFGSLIRPDLTNISDVLRLIDEKKVADDMFLQDVHKKVLKVLKQADYLSPKYHLVIANPPYMGGKGMNKRLGKWAKDNYPDTKSDLYSMFIDKIIESIPQDGLMGFMTPFTWMFLSSHEKLRSKILNYNTILTLVKPSYTAFFQSAIVPVCAFVIKKRSDQDYIGSFFDLDYLGNAEDQPKRFMEAKTNPQSKRFFRASSIDFKKIPGSPIAFWVSDSVRTIFEEGTRLKDIGDTRQGMATSDNNRFLRLWSEVSYDRIFFNASSREDALSSKKKWFPYNKGGKFRRWYGNAEFVVNWENDGKELLSYAASLYGSPTRTIKSLSEYFKPCISWSKISSSNIAMRYYPKGYIFDVAGCSIFSEDQQDLKHLLGYANTTMVKSFLTSISPTMNFEAGQVASLPIIKVDDYGNIDTINQLIKTAKEDWDFAETSWDFRGLQILSENNKQNDMQDAWLNIEKEWNTNVAKFKSLEEQNNQYFLEKYNIQNELDASVPIRRNNINM